MNVTKDIIAGGAALVSLAGLAFAGYQYNSSHKKYYRKFDVKKMDVLTGKLAEVRFSGKKKSENRGVEFLIETEEKVIPVHLGPAWFVNKQSENFKMGDVVTIKGSKMHANHEPVLIAQEVKKGNDVLRLRDEYGYPYWTICKQ